MERNSLYSLGMDFTLEGGMEEAVSVDLDGEWGEDTVISRHPGFEEPNLVFLSGEVGDGGDHMNMCFKNISDQPVTIKGSTIVVQLRSRDPLDCPTQHLEDNLPLTVQMFRQETGKINDHDGQDDEGTRRSGQANEDNQEMVVKAVDTSGCESEIHGTDITGDNNMYVFKTYTWIFRAVN